MHDGRDVTVAFLHALAGAWNARVADALMSFMTPHLRGVYGRLA